MIFDGNVEWTPQESEGITLYAAELPLTAKPDYGFPTLTLNGIEYIGEYIPSGEEGLYFYSSESHTEENIVAVVIFPESDDEPYQIMSLIEPQSHIIITIEPPDWQTLYSGTVTCSSDNGAYNGTFQSTREGFFPEGTVIKATVNGVNYPTAATRGDQCFFDDFSLRSYEDGSVIMSVSAAGDYVVDFKYVVTVAS